MDVFDAEILELWKALEKYEVRYIMIGGFATNLHGFSRTTADLDLWIEESAENRKKLKKVLYEIGLGDLPQIESMQFVAGWSSISMKSGFQLDIMTSIKGFEQEKFEECYNMAPSAEIYDVQVQFLHINHLITAKEASKRPKDQIDLIELKKIRDNLEI